MPDARGVVLELSSGEAAGLDAGVSEYPLSLEADDATGIVSEVEEYGITVAEVEAI